VGFHVSLKDETKHSLRCHIDMLYLSNAAYCPLKRYMHLHGAHVQDVYIATTPRIRDG
jgi:hypothetical protein